MRPIEVCRSWVVYRMTLSNGQNAGNVVCEQRDWERFDAQRPGFHTLLHSGLKTEQEAEKLARGTVGERPPRPKKKLAWAVLPHPEAQPGAAPEPSANSG